MELQTREPFSIINTILNNDVYTSLDKYKNMKTKEFEVEIEGVRTTITCKFDKGYLVTFSSKSETILEPPKKSKKKERFIKKRA